MKFTSVAEWLSHLEAIHPSEIELGLERVAAIGEQLDCLKPAPLVILVAGTNGKGTTCALMSRLLQVQGLRVGQYSSPHIQSYNERVCTNGQQISDADLCASFAAVEQARDKTSLTYFEFGTLAALLHFKQQNLDAVVLEIGLGGRLDAVNIVEPDISVVTSIGLDHQAWLGDRVEQIAYEKCSIARKDKYLVCGQPEAPEEAKTTVDKIGGRWIGRETEFRAALNDDGVCVTYANAQGYSKEIKLGQFSIPYPNIATAIQTLSLLDQLPDEQMVQRVVSELRVPGRMQTFKKGDQTLILDVAHNPQAAAYLTSILPKTDVLILAMLEDKDVEAVVNNLPTTQELWLCGLDCPRGLSVDLLEKRIMGNRFGKKVGYSSVSQALDSMNEQGTYLLVGSFFTVQEALNWLKEQEPKWNSI